MPSDEAAVLAANEAFYRAFSERDIEAMEKLWASGPHVACVHPGWDALHGRDDVMESWRAILDSPQSPTIRFERATAHVLGDMGFVVCVEDVDGSAIVATNVFVREGGAWKVAHHHGGIVARRRRSVPSRPPPSRGELN